MICERRSLNSINRGGCCSARAHTLFISLSSLISIKFTVIWLIPELSFLIWSPAASAHPSSRLGSCDTGRPRMWNAAVTWCGSTCSRSTVSFFLLLFCIFLLCSSVWILFLWNINSEQATIMQATIYANRLPRFRSKLAAGKMFFLSGFDVARCTQNYRLTDSPFLIQFSDLTDFDELTDLVSPLPNSLSYFQWVYIILISGFVPMQPLLGCTIEFKNEYTGTCFQFPT